MAKRSIADITRIFFSPSGRQFANEEAKVARTVKAQPDADELASEGDRARSRKEWASAAESYRRALEVRPEWPAIRVQLGHMLKESGQLAAAEEAYRHALKEEPGNADTYLHLGHALKLQHRLAEAEAAYLDALVRQPDLQPAREELHALGLRRRVIEQHLAAVERQALARNSGKQDAPGPDVASTDVPPLIEPPAAEGLRGSLVEIGRQHIAGTIHNVMATDLPLMLVCRAGTEVIATTVVETGSGNEPTATQGSFAHTANETLASTLPGDVPFRMSLADRPSGSVLRVHIEPMGIELTGSPFLALGDDVSSILDRLERLELAVDGGGVTSDVEYRLAFRLTRAVLGMATARIEAVLDHQRALFERQLGAVEALLARAGRDSIAVSNPCGPQAGLVDADATSEEPLPTHAFLDASMAFPGLGWSRPEPARVGGEQRWMQKRGSLSILIDAAPAYLLRVTIVALANRHVLDTLRVSSAGVTAQQWIEVTPGSSGAAQEWMLTALIQGAARQGDGSLSFSIDGGPHVTVAGAGISQSIAVRRLEVMSVPAIDAPDIELSASAPWFAQSWAKPATGAGLRLVREQALVVLPAVRNPGDARLQVQIDGAPGDASLALNDVPLAVEFCADGHCTADVPSGLWSSGSANLLTIAVPNAAAMNDSPAIIVHGVYIAPQNSPP